MTTTKRVDPSIYAYDQIKQLLLHGVIVPGQKLIVRDFSEKLGMSQTPITKALNQLVNEDLLIYITHRGFSVRDISESEIMQLYEIRLELECLNLINCIKNLNPESEKELENKYQQFVNYNPIQTDSKKVVFDMNFHREIAHIGGNQYSIKYTDMILNQISYRYRVEKAIDRRKEEIKKEHERIYNYIKNKDKKNAIREIKSHILDSHNLMMQYYKEFQVSLRNTV